MTEHYVLAGTRIDAVAALSTFDPVVAAFTPNIGRLEDGLLSRNQLTVQIDGVIAVTTRDLDSIDANDRNERSSRAIWQDDVGAVNRKPSEGLANDNFVVPVRSPNAEHAGIQLGHNRRNRSRFERFHDEPTTIACFGFAKRHRQIPVQSAGRSTPAGVESTG